MPLALQSVLNSPLPPGTKGLPDPNADLTIAEIGRQGWSLLDGDLPMPVAVLKSAALRANLTAMQGYFDAVGVCFAPHGKTTLSPQLFERQLDAGAWGITVATIAQLALCHAVGVPRADVRCSRFEHVEIARRSRWARIVRARLKAKLQSFLL